VRQLQLGSPLCRPHPSQFVAEVRPVQKLHLGPRRQGSEAGLRGRLAPADGQQQGTGESS
jgi:hypothetical protein